MQHLSKANVKDGRKPDAAVGRRRGASAPEQGLSDRQPAVAGAGTASGVGGASASRGRSWAAVPLVQPKAQRIGAAQDALEQEADRVAAQVLTGGESGPLSRATGDGGGAVRRSVSAGAGLSGGGGASAPFFQQLEGSKGGGQTLPTGVRQDFESRFGADFSGVRIHDGAGAAQLSRQIQARAFTSGQDIFFGAGEYRPDTSSGRQVLAHELTHVGQQNPGILGGQGDGGGGLLSATATTVQPLRQYKDGKYYSLAAPGPFAEYRADSDDDAFLTAVSSGGMGGGHTTVYLEYFEKSGAPLAYQIDLGVGNRHQESTTEMATDDITYGASSGTTVSGKTGSGNGAGQISITQQELSAGDAEVRLASKGSGQKKTWKRTRADALKAKKRADEVEKEASNYQYYLLGKGPNRRSLNCARFGQSVLKAAGVPVHIGFWKLPSKITRASATDESIQQVYTSRDLTSTVRNSMPDPFKTQSAFVAGAQLSSHAGLLPLFEEAGKMLEKYNKFEEPILRYQPLKVVVGTMATFLIRAAAKEHAAGGSGGYATEQTVQFVRDDFYNALSTEIDALVQEVQADLLLIRGASDPSKAPLPSGVFMLPMKLRALLAGFKEIRDHATSKSLIDRRLSEWMDQQNAWRQRLHLRPITAADDWADEGELLERVL